VLPGQTGRKGRKAKPDPRVLTAPTVLPGPKDRRAKLDLQEQTALPAQTVRKARPDPRGLPAQTVRKDRKVRPGPLAPTALPGPKGRRAKLDL
jgi:hypothetical protein